MGTRGIFLSITIMIALSEPLPGWAASLEPEMCTDLAKFSCASENPNAAKGGDGDDEFKKLESLRDKTILPIIERFRLLLASPENTYFRKKALAAAGWTPLCASTLERDRARCDGLTASWLAGRAASKVFSMTEWEASRLRSEILTTRGELSDVNLLESDPLFQETVEKLSTNARRLVSSPQTVSEIQNTVFPRIKNILIKTINQYFTDKKAKEIAIEKVKAIKWNPKPCYVNKPDELSVAPFLISNAHYFSESNTFRICDGFMFQSKNEFELAFAIGHELAHSIDPCGISRGPSNFVFKYSGTGDLNKVQEEYPVKKLLNCLRDKNSVNAERLEGSPGRMPLSCWSCHNARPSKMAPDPISFCTGSDQIGESVADWFSARIMPQYISAFRPNLTLQQRQLGFSHALRQTCETKRERGFEVHPRTNNRINKILLVDPDIRKLMGCSPNHVTYKFCDPASSTPESGPQRGGMK